MYTAFVRLSGCAGPSLRVAQTPRLRFVVTSRESSIRRDCAMQVLEEGMAELLRFRERETVTDGMPASGWLP